jgi:phosphatidylserine/phosphatidylglycerophosphate/cardiolipin synthase-like enzyme
MSPVLVTDATYFAPYDDVSDVLVSLAKSATTSIHLDIYGLTFGPLIDALIERDAAGVHVNIVADHSQAMGTTEKPQLQRLCDAGIDLLVGVSARGGIDHSKYIVVDGELGAADPASCVGFGSFNFSLSAESQDNTFSVRSDAGLVSAFLANWQRVHDDAAGRHPEWQPIPSTNASGVLALRLP